MMRYFLLLFLFLNVQCRISTRVNPMSCEAFSSSYIDSLEQFSALSTFENWEEILNIHSEISSLALGSWKQNTQVLEVFSNHFISFLKTRVWLECGLLSESTPSQTQRENQRNVVNRISYIHTEFQVCILNEWKNSKNLISQSCLLYFTEK